MKFKPILEIPFDKDGNQLHYPLWNHQTWKDNYEFHGVMKFDSIERGRSAAFFHIHDETTGIKYTMFMTEVLSVLQNGKVMSGVVYGRWTFCKRGANYGLKLVIE